MSINIPKPELIQVGKLRVDGENPNRMTPKQIERLKTSIEKYGFIVPIITNKDLLVADGEQRLTAAKELGLPKVLVIRLDVEDVDRRLLRQVLNKLRGEHDLVADAYEFERIIQAGHEDELKHLLDLSDSQIERYLTEIHEPKAEDYEIPEIDKIQTSIQRGDIYGLGSHRLMCGDATNKRDVEALMNGKKVDMVFTDPPYGVNLNTNRFQNMPSQDFKTLKRHNYQNIIDDDNPFNFSLFADLPVKEQFWWGANHYCQNLPKDGTWFVWDKKKEGMEATLGGEFELCWSKQTHKPKIIRVLWTGFLAKEKDETRLHPTQKPLELCRWFLSHFSHNPNIVLDLFGGSGSTLIACEQTSRTCYMMEIDPRYCQIIIDRWESYTKQKAELVKNGENHVSKNNN